MLSKRPTPAPLNHDTAKCQHGKMCNHTHAHKIITFSLPSPALKSSGLIVQLMRINTLAAGLPPPVEGESQPKTYKTLQLRQTDGNQECGSDSSPRLVIVV